MLPARPGEQGQEDNAQDAGEDLHGAPGGTAGGVLQQIESGCVTIENLIAELSDEIHLARTGIKCRKWLLLRCQDSADDLTKSPEPGNDDWAF